MDKCFSVPGVRSQLSIIDLKKTRVSILKSRFCPGVCKCSWESKLRSEKSIVTYFRHKIKALYCCIELECPHNPCRDRVACRVACRAGGAAFLGPPASCGTRPFFSLARSVARVSPHAGVASARCTSSFRSPPSQLALPSALVFPQCHNRGTSTHVDDVT